MGLVFNGSFFQAIFENVDPESLTNQVLKYHKVVLQLEKGLPPNAVVPKLRGKVDKMRHKVTCVHLLNPVLQLFIYLSRFSTSNSFRANQHFPFVDIAYPRHITSANPCADKRNKSLRAKNIAGGKVALNQSNAI